MNGDFMNCVDLFADIIPGRSAAGFELGLNIMDFRELISIAENWDEETYQIQEILSITPEWLFVPNIKIGMNKKEVGGSYYYGYGAVKLFFGPEGKLETITVSEGYKGKLFGSVQIGDKLSKVCGFFDLIYDDVEELHFPVENSELSGIIFHAEEDSIEESPDQLIRSMSIVP